MRGSLCSRKERKQFFSEEKNQKTFVSWRALPDKSATATQKSFASFSRKEGLSS
jgi:hypothetical protein